MTYASAKYTARVIKAIERDSTARLHLVMDRYLREVGDTLTFSERVAATKWHAVWFLAGAALWLVIAVSSALFFDAPLVMERLEVGIVFHPWFAVLIAWCALTAVGALYTLFGATRTQASHLLFPSGVRWRKPLDDALLKRIQASTLSYSPSIDREIKNLLNSETESPSGPITGLTLTIVIQLAAMRSATYPHNNEE